MLEDLRYSLRALFHAPRFAALAIAALALGIGATIAMFTVVQAVLLEPLLSGARPRRGANAFAVVADDSQSLQVHDGGEVRGAEGVDDEGTRHAPTLLRQARGIPENRSRT